METSYSLTRPKSEESLGDAVVLQKQPLRKLQFALKRISKVVTMHLEFLTRQKANIEKFQRTSQWEKVHAEQINASRTVQQLKADIYELEIVGHQIVDEDLSLFEEQADTIKENILSEIAAFVVDHQDAIQPCTALRSLSLSNNDSLNAPIQPERSPTPPMAQFPTSSSTEELFMTSEPSSLETAQLQKLQRSNSTALRSWEHLKKEITDLNALLTGFANTVRSHRASIDVVESNIDSTYENVRKGTIDLNKAARYKLMLLPFSGALIGGIVGGPIGLVAGYKAAGVALALGGGLIGFTGGRFLQKKKTAALDGNNSVELEEMTHGKLRNSLSLNDLKT